MQKPVAACIGMAVVWAVSVQAARVAPPKISQPRRTVVALQTPSPSVAAPAQTPAAAAPAQTPPAALVGRYCVTCHNEKLKTANLLLDKANAVNVSESAPVWEKVIVKLRTRAMPPPGNRRPDNATYDAVASWLESELDKAAAAQPNPGRVAVHRLNRAEYINAIRDLLAVEIDGNRLLPPDGKAFGFDNIADALVVTPDLMERYLSAATKISRLALGDPNMPLELDKYTVMKDGVEKTHAWQIDRMGEEFPLGSRGGVVARHYFPVDGEYVIKLRLDRTYTGDIRGAAEPNQIDIRVDDVRVGLLTVGGKDKDGARYGRGATGGGGEEAAYRADDEVQVKVPIKAGAHEVVATLVRSTSALPEGFGPARAIGQFRPEEVQPIWGHAYDTDPNAQMGVVAMTIAGPYGGVVPQDSASRRRIFVCRPTNADDLACATRILTSLARRAYRRAVTKEDVATLLDFYKRGRTQNGFEEGIKLGLERILISPSFLFRVEDEPAKIAPATPYRISDVELASRLSFFLWSSIPDDELLDVAASGKLKDPSVLDKQVRRMLADPRARKALVDNFFSQWLQIRNVPAVTPDTTKKFPWFTDNLRMEFQKETELFLDSQLSEDRSVLDLLRANYTFVNEDLARHYGIPNVYGSHFRRVTITDPHRGGILGQASVLLVTSQSNRTSPTVRGKYLLENILAAPMPPPPPNVDTNLKVEGEGIKPKTVRETLEMHRKNPTCASCHARMDPLGFGLENFDGIGRWRDLDADNPIDASGVLLDGTKFQGPAELRKVLLERKEQFVMAATQKLLTYALGRELQYYDAPALRRIVRESAATDYRWSSIILEIVRSLPFQMRRSRES